MMQYEYIKDGDEIYRRSFAIIRQESDLARFSADEAEIVIRMIHAAGSVQVAQHIVFDAQFVPAARAAIAAGMPIFCDAEMVARGITTARFLARNEVICTLRDPATPTLATELGTTRSAAALKLWLPRLEGAIIAIGNAPTALFFLLEMLRDGAPKPAAILGMPVGFVGAAESKHALTCNSYGVPFAVILGRLGGSAITAAALNALARPGI